MNGRIYGCVTPSYRTHVHRGTSTLLREKVKLGVLIHVYLKLGSIKEVGTEKVLQTQMPARITQIKYTKGHCEMVKYETSRSGRELEGAYCALRHANSD